MIPCDAIPEDSLKWNEEAQGYMIDADREVDITASAAICCGLCDEEGAEELKEWLNLGGSDFQRPR